MEIIKRDGHVEPYQSEKIKAAVTAAFDSINSKVEEQVLDSITADVQAELEQMQQKNESLQVEKIQDLVEKTLVTRNFYNEVKSFILYRDSQAKKRAARQHISNLFEDRLISDVLKGIQNDYDSDEYHLDLLYHKFFSFQKENMTATEKLTMLIKAAVELTSQESPKWEYIAARLLMLRFQIKLQAELSKLQITSFYDKICYLTGQELYGSYILQAYSKEEIDVFETYFIEERNHLFTYSSLEVLLKRYVIHTRQLIPFETPQEMFMGIAMHLAMHEKENRMEWVKRFYNMLSQLQVTMATPTLSNARKPFHQLSSCFVDTVPDSLTGIYRSITNFAQVSKFGGGMGMYFGKVRASGSPIRGFQGAAGGVIRWIKLANDTAVAVDQLGVRQGAVAVYLDAWHKDIPEFLQLRTNNGDDRMKAHDVFPAICYPDLFWKMARDKIEEDWYLMCPHEILSVKGYALEDFYGEEWEKRYFDCVADHRITKRVIPIKELIRLIIKSAVETGTPFTFNRDHVNAMNPNAHTGMIYCSNLCTEIAQNMGCISNVTQEIKIVNGETIVIDTTKAGEFVVCNLASLSLGNLDVLNQDELRQIIHSTIRALDNVIDLNFYPLPYAEITNQKYRSVGLGVSGYHHLLAKHKINWESEEHLTFVDKIFEDINYYAIEASVLIAKEKGTYDLFEGSDWQTGAYFEKRGYTSQRWQTLKQAVQTNGMRNAYLMAIAPTSTTSIIAGTTAGLDPVMNRYYLEEKKNSIVPRVAPDLSMETFWYYKNAHLIDQTWTVKACGVRQRHIDQAQSLNLYITNEYTFRQVLHLYILAWEKKVKTIYYIRSKALEVEECEVCSS